MGLDRVIGDVAKAAKGVQLHFGDRTKGREALPKLLLPQEIGGELPNRAY